MNLDGTCIVQFMATRTCEHCGTSIEGSNGNRRYCDVACRNAAHWQRHKPGPKIVSCNYCGNDLVRRRNERYCTPECAKAARNAANVRPGTCEKCGAEFIAPARRRFCDDCRQHGPSAVPVGTTRTTLEGYVMVRVPKGTPGVRPDRTWMPEHRYVMQQHLGRPLAKHENVHHIDGDKANNAIENLELWDRPQPKGVRVVCLDCGSHNVESVEL